MAGSFMTSIATLMDRRPAFGYALALALCCVATFVVFDLAHADLTVPFGYSGDALFYGMTVQTVLEHGWYCANDRLGMPFGQVLLDFPVPDSLSLLMLRAIGTLTSDWGVAMNLFYLAGLPLTTLTSLFVLRRFGVTYWPALLASLLYAFASYRFVRGEHHLLNMAYFTVPPMVMVLLWLCAGEVAPRRPADLVRGKTIASVLACMAIASTGGVYFSFFACVLLVGVAAYSTFSTRRWSAALSPLLFALVTFATLVLNLLPSILYRAEHGTVGTAARSFAESEMWGLKLVQMLLPVPGHRLASWAALRQTYDAAPLINRDAPVSLGVIGSLGVVLALGCLLFGRRESANAASPPRLEHLGMLTGVALVVSSIGGLGVMFAIFVSPQIRAYDRIAIYVTFFALMVVAIVSDRARARWCHSPKAHRWFALAMLLLTGVGILDQTPARPLPHAERIAREFGHDREYFAGVEAALPAGAMVFQLPVQEFPEGPSYDSLRPYLHTRALRFSGAPMRGRTAHRWQEHVAALPLPRMLEKIALAGFSALLIDRFHAGSGVDALVAEIGRRSRVPARTSADTRYVLFELAVPESTPGLESDRAARREAALHPVFVAWGAGFSDPEGAPADPWRWGQARGEMRLINELARTRSIEIDMVVTAAGEGVLGFESPLLTDTVSVGRAPTRIVRRLEVPSGTHRVRIQCSAAPLVLPNDGRSVVFRVSEFSVREGD